MQQSIDCVVCPICKKHFKVISNSHVHFHGLTMQQFRQQFPSALLICRDTRQALSKQRIGKIVSQKTRNKISMTKKGVPRPDMKGDNNISKRPEVRKKNSEAHKGKPRPQSVKDAISKANKGRLVGDKNPSKRPEVRAKISAALKGRKQSKEWRRKNSEAQKGKKASPKTRAKKSKITKTLWAQPEYKRQQRQSRLDYWADNPERREERSKAFSGEGNVNWQGGIFFEPYSAEFNKRLKRLIKQRDDYTCQRCGKKLNSNRLDPHHIDYDKMNCDEVNLITLCKKCHGESNFNRVFWQQVFVVLMYFRQQVGAFS